MALRDLKLSAKKACCSLDGFMNRADYEVVIHHMKPENVCLGVNGLLACFRDVAKTVKPGDKTAFLVDVLIEGLKEAVTI